MRSVTKVINKVTVCRQRQTEAVWPSGSRGEREHSEARNHGEREAREREAREREANDSEIELTFPKNEGWMQINAFCAILSLSFSLQIKFGHSSAKPAK